MILKNISGKEQLTNTIEGKKYVLPGQTFESNKGAELLRNYGDLFIEVEKMEENKEVKVEKKFTNKKK